MNEKIYITAHEERVNENTLILSLLYVSSEVVEFVSSRQRFTLKDGTEIRKNDTNLFVLSTEKKMVGRIEGLTGPYPHKRTVIKSEYPIILDKISAEFFKALYELTHVIKHFKHGPVAYSTDVYTPMIVAAWQPKLLGTPIDDNATASFIKQLNNSTLNSSTLSSVDEKLIM